MELGGRWRAIEADEALLVRYPGPGFDDSSWAELEVPGHWRSSPPFATSDGPILLRRRFETPAPPPGRRSWLIFEGMFYVADVWLDGAYLGDTEGYFFPHVFEVTGPLARRAEHVLAVEVTCTPERDRTAKHNLTGVFQHWDCFDPDWNPGGIWRPVRLSETGEVRIVSLKVLCPQASARRALLTFRAVLDASAAGKVELRTTVGQLTDQVQYPTLAAGRNRLDWHVAVDRPPLWWPHALGSPELTDVSVGVRPADGQPAAGWSDRRTLRTGIREVRLQRWIASVNGERLFLKGSNQGPTRMALGEATPAQLEGDVTLAKQAGLDLLRLHAHVSRPELYAAADRHGLLLWQDLPLQWGYDAATRHQAARQAREAVDLLGHHPSIAIWCAHNEPLRLDVPTGATGDLRALAARALRGLVLPSWNKSVLDPALRRALEAADASRPVLAHSGVPTRDSHLYFGWYHGRERDLARAAAAWPRLVQFVSEFGAQAVPATGSFLEPERWPDLDWAQLGRRHALQRRFFAKHGLDPASFATFEAWRDATQAYQATLIRRQVETLRRLKYRPTGGFAQFCLGDGHPAVTWSVLDHERRPKLGYQALTAACAPVIVVADRPAATYRPGDRARLDVHAVSDRRAPLPAVTVTARLGWGGGPPEVRRWTGDLPADSCVRIGAVDVAVPNAVGPLVLELELVAGGTVVATNRYESLISPPA